MTSSSPYRESDGKNAILVIGLLVIGVIYLLYGINHEGVWLDEAYTAAIVKLPLLKIWKTIGSHDTHPPLYYLLLRVHVLLFGDSDFTLRLFSVIGVVSSALLGIGPLKRACGAETGIAYVFIVFITPITIVYAHEARMYTWAAFFVTGSVLYAYLAVMQKEPKDWVKYTLFTVAAMYTHYYALLASVITYVLLFLWLVFGGKKYLSICLIVGAVAAVCYIPWILEFVHQALRVMHRCWIQEATGTTLLQTFIYPHSYQFNIPPPPLSSLIAFGIYVMLAAFGIFKALESRRKDVALIIFSLSIFLLTIMAGFVMSLTLRPVLLPRFMMPVLGLFLLSVAYGIARITGQSIRILISILIVILTIPQIVQIHTHYFKGPIKEVASFLHGKVGTNDVFLHTDIATAAPFSHHFPDHLHFLYKSGTAELRRHRIYHGIIVGSDVKKVLNEDADVWLVGWLDSEHIALNRCWVVSGQLEPDESKRFESPFYWLDVELIHVNIAYPFRTAQLSCAENGTGTQ